MAAEAGMAVASPPQSVGSSYGSGINGSSSQSELLGLAPIQIFCAKPLPQCSFWSRSEGQGLRDLLPRASADSSDSLSRTDAGHSYVTSKSLQATATSLNFNPVPQQLLPVASTPATASAVGLFLPGTGTGAGATPTAIIPDLTKCVPSTDQGLRKMPLVIAAVQVQQCGPTYSSLPGACVWDFRFPPVKVHDSSLSVPLHGPPTIASSSWMAFLHNTGTRWSREEELVADRAGLRLRCALPEAPSASSESAAAGVGGPGQRAAAGGNHGGSWQRAKRALRAAATCRDLWLCAAFGFSIGLGGNMFSEYMASKQPPPAEPEP